MTFLPVVERELRVAARKRSTFWVRMVAALVAFAIGAGFLCVAENSPFGFAPATLGKTLFSTLSWISLITSLSAGLFLTADCLSEEKREGTLGFLFLTDLRGYDVVLGKLLSTSLRGVCALLAILPMLAIPLLMGGVSGAQLWQMVLALINALFISLVVGLFVSSISRDSQKAMAGTLLLLILLAWAGPAIDSILTALTGSRYQMLSYSSPVYLFESAGLWVAAPFWPGLLVNQLIGWALLAWTCRLLPRTWQMDRDGGRALFLAGDRAQRRAWWKVDLSKHRAVNRKLLEVNPAIWLAGQERWPTFAVWGLTLLLGITVLITPRAFRGWLGTLAPLTLLLYLMIASQSGRPFIESRRTGFIELLLSTPLTGRQIVQGQWRALVRMFGPALAVFLVVYGVSSFVSQRATWGLMAATTAAVRPVPTATNVATSTTAVGNSTVVSTSTITIAPSAGMVTPVPLGRFAVPPAYLTVGLVLMVTFTVAANLVALAWFGMWMGLTTKNTGLATLKTIIFTQIVPWFVINFASGLLVALVLMPRMFMGAAMSSQFAIWYPLFSTAVTTLLNLVKDGAFVLWARRKLYSEFRERAVPTVAPPALPPPIAPSSLPNASLRTPSPSG